jgi:cytosine/adenosine deaminase-related metal-dependent hydrolase
MMRAARYVDAGISVGLGSDLAAGPELSLFRVMGAAATTQQVLQLSGQMRGGRPLGLVDSLRLGTLDGARVLGIDDRVGSIEVGKDADLILVDPHRTAPVPSAPDLDEPDELLSRLIFRPDPQMVRGAWVRGKLLPA